VHFTRRCGELNLRLFVQSPDISYLIEVQDSEDGFHFGKQEVEID